MSEKNIIQHLHERRLGISSYDKPLPEFPVYLAPDMNCPGRSETVAGKPLGRTMPGAGERENFVWFGCEPTSASRIPARRTKRFFRVRMSDALFRRACVHEAGHYVVGLALADRSGCVPIVASVASEVTGQTGVLTEFVREEGLDQTRDSYMAEIAILLAGAAAEEPVAGCRGAGCGGPIGSDFDPTTRLAVLIEASFGHGGSMLHAIASDESDISRILASDADLAFVVLRYLIRAYGEAEKIGGQESIRLGFVQASLAATGRFEAQHGQSEPTTEAPPTGLADLSAGSADLSAGSADLSASRPQNVKHDVEVADGRHTPSSGREPLEGVEAASVARFAIAPAQLMNPFNPLGPPISVLSPLPKAKVIKIGFVLPVSNHVGTDRGHIRRQSIRLRRRHFEGLD
ncbi:hypothetical protein [Aurantimonas endophytica]|uniref:Peptidase M41-like protein n=1 Tax=Aurantimonas endophytica TaxID=1522175 RepID=A0A7W6H9Q1_9HYPH|nr:hypothetical protein [Aurantimonas endophytica]MBB4001191.1 hypothetical protein [Aurantimonas endophytica]MCO6403155.1 hypothetical protein [Aurantimonas endophytica]